MSAAVTEDLLIVGAGGFARETAQAVRDVAAADGARGRAPRWRLAGHLDDDPALHGREVDGVPVRGGCDLVHELPAARVVVCVGSPRDYAVRARLVRRLGLPVDRYATVVHPTAAVSASSVLGAGSVLLAHCVLTAAVRVGSHVAVMPQVVLTHDDTVEDFATLASGVRLGGGVRVGRGAYVGGGAGAGVRGDRRLVADRHGQHRPRGRSRRGGVGRQPGPPAAAGGCHGPRRTGPRAGTPGGSAAGGPTQDAPVPARAAAHGRQDGTGPTGPRPQTRMESPVV
ncbi:hypothetical protein MRQ86_30590 [Streptomyces sp. MMS21 TC-5]|uniref:PglD-related sugar-binding protein n=1 Tax=Streptomyces sp. MMS21 TC-5 TaxID=2925833 RepID=UPI001F616B13|nr:hypothetical protein [Streptomyces sp. MMS21 TC-5]MCI4084586.1 hypothetical protein [Streptomyces sp. MMS21 TC-5]